MYTVLRFRSDADTGGKMRDLRDEAITRFGEDHVGGIRRGMFACDITRASDWTSHESELMAFVSDNASWIKRCKETGASWDLEVSVDIALGPEDMGQSAWMGIDLPLELLHVLLDVGAMVEVTVYNVYNPPEAEAGVQR